MTTQVQWYNMMNEMHHNDMKSQETFDLFMIALWMRSIAKEMERQGMPCAPEDVLAYCGTNLNARLSGWFPIDDWHNRLIILTKVNRDMAMNLITSIAVPNIKNLPRRRRKPATN